jgi:ubiquinone/menaquinone biosynthesis C-methylase UbiE
MTQDYVPALGRFGATRHYDRALALLTREKRWRRALVERIGGLGDGTVVDIGCGTGSLAIIVKAAQPQARVIGLDPDSAALSIARAKAAACDADVEWMRTMGDRGVALLGAGAADIVVSSLVLHQCPLDMKRAILAEAWTLLRPGGRLLICDYGIQPTVAMRTAFLLIQVIDGFEATAPNAAGILPRLIDDAGFLNIAEDFALSTVTGRLAIYSAVRG